MLKLLHSDGLMTRWRIPAATNRFSALRRAILMAAEV